MHAQATSEGPLAVSAARSQAPAYALIGAAATLASIFRCPMTATLLVFELSRDYDIVLPLLAAAGTGPRVVEYALARTHRPNHRLTSMRCLSGCGETFEL